MSDIQPGTYTATAQKVYIESVGQKNTPMIRIVADVLGQVVRVPIWLPNPEHQTPDKLAKTASMAYKALELVGIDPSTAMSVIAEDPDIIAGAEFKVDIDYNERGQMDASIPLGFDAKAPEKKTTDAVQDLLNAVKK